MATSSLDFPLLSPACIICFEKVNLSSAHTSIEDLSHWFLCSEHFSTQDKVSLTCLLQTLQNTQNWLTCAEDVCQRLLLLSSQKPKLVEFLKVILSLLQLGEPPKTI